MKESQSPGDDGPAEMCDIFGRRCIDRRDVICTEW
jgi:hypothetical protein